MVICADCGNNCCNGGTRDINGSPCGCDEAYEDQEAHSKDPECVKFAHDIRDDVIRGQLFTLLGGRSGPS